MEANSINKKQIVDYSTRGVSVIISKKECNQIEKIHFIRYV